MLMGIENKVALVTGAARRRSIGRATALRLAREGADIACLDIARPYDEFPGHGTASSDELDEVVAEIVAAGGSVIAQDEASSVVWGMPGAAANAGICSAILPLNQIGSKLVRVFAGDRS